MERPIFRFKALRLAVVLAIVCTLLLSCGLTAFAAEEGSTDKPATEPTQTATVENNAEQSETDAESTAEQSETDGTAEETSTPIVPVELKNVLYPADVQTIIEDGGRRIVKTYILTADESPADISRDSFELDGWRYAVTDITQKKTSGTDTRSHTEAVEINTDSNDMNTILAQLSPTLEYESEDGYCGIIALDLASVKCEVAGQKTSSYTVSATREYPHLSNNDLSLIPKTITDNGRTLELDGVTWEAQHTVNVDYQDIPDSYRAVAKYTAKASKSVVTGYITTAEYSGEISKVLSGDTVYTAYFFGTEINPEPKPTTTPEPTETAETTAPTDALEQTETSEQSTPTPTPKMDNANGSIPIAPLIGVALIAALLAGGSVYLLLRHNVKVYAIGDKGRVFVAKVRISAKNPTIDLTPLIGRTDDKCFGLEIDRLAAKGLNGRTVEVIFGPAKLEHKIAYEGNTYRIEVDFHSMTIRAVY